MDPLTAASLAGTVVQIVDFAIKVVSKGHHIYLSADNSLPENSDLELVANDLLILQTRLEKEISSGSNASGGDDNDAIRRLASASNAVAKELLQRLNRVKVQGRYRKWNSLRQAVKSVWSKSEVDAMAARLGSFRDEIQARMISSVRSQMDESHKLMTKIEAKIERLDRGIDASSPQVGLVSPPGIQYGLGSGQSSVRLAAGVEKSAQGSHSSENDIYKVVLKAFSYSEQTQRHDDIPEAHAKTFRWALQRQSQQQVPWDNLIDWLQSDEPLYWIRGKAASGKSTLMKFIIQQEEVCTTLQKWAYPMQLIQVSFFFWALGTSLQQSQQGLLLSIIRQIFVQHRSSVRTVLPVFWDQCSQLSEHDYQTCRAGWKQWRLEELKHILSSLLETISNEAKVCIFIDGLDEFSGPHAEIANFFLKLSSLKHVKCCISSRPLTSIEYEYSGYKGLQLQYLTNRCISEFVKDRMSSHRRFAEYQRENPKEANQLIGNVVTRSNGVFLWVDLVVRSLLDGLTNHDSLQDLHQRLVDLPPELDALYSVILRSIDPPFYRSQAAKLLLAFHQVNRIVTSIALSFIDEQDPDYVYEADLTPLTRREAKDRCESMTVRLNSRCKGLLEVRTYGFHNEAPDHVDYPHIPDQVQYLHLTVKEFLEKPSVWSEVNGWITDDAFDCNVACAKGFMSLVKKTIGFHGWGGHIYTLLDSAVTYLRRAESSTARSQDRLIEDLDRLACQIYPYSDTTHWSFSWVRDQEACKSHERSLNLLKYCVSKGLCTYVGNQSTATISALNSGMKAGLLTWTFRTKQQQWWIGDLNYGKVSSLVTEDASFICYREIANEPTVVPMIKLLLDFGLSPNETRLAWGKVTPWYRLLSLLWQKRSEAQNIEGIALLMGVVELFIIYGADVTTRIPEIIYPIGGREIGSVLQELFAKAPTHASKKLSNLLSERRVTESQKKAFSKPISSRSLEDRITSPRNSKKRSTPTGNNFSPKRHRRY